MKLTAWFGKTANKVCPCCNGVGEHDTGFECYLCDGGGDVPKRTPDDKKCDGLYEDGGESHGGASHMSAQKQAAEDADDPGLIHRGLSVVLPEHIHKFVHDEDQPAGARAHMLLAHVRKARPEITSEEVKGTTGGLGNYWAPRKEKAAEYGDQGGWKAYHDHEHEHGCGDDETGYGGCPSTHVILHAGTPPEKHHWTENFRGAEKYDPDVSWRLPVRPDAKLMVHGISWKQGHDNESGVHRDFSAEKAEPYSRYDFLSPVKKRAGANGDLPGDLRMDFTPHHTDEKWLPRPDTGERDTFHRVQAFTGDDSARVGEMSWYPKTGEVAHVWVHPDHRRRGIGSAMWNYGVQAATEQGHKLPEHSPNQSDAGAAWAPHNAKRATVTFGPGGDQQIGEKHYEDDEEGYYKGLWNRWHPLLQPTIHRHLALDLPKDHPAHDTSLSTEQRAHSILDHVSKGEAHTPGRLGYHWTDDPEYDHLSTGQRIHSGQTSATIHAQTPPRHHIEDNEYELKERRAVHDWDTDEREVPLKRNAPVHVTGVSWHSTDGPQYHRFAEPITRRAVLDPVLQAFAVGPPVHRTAAEWFHGSPAETPFARFDFSRNRPDQEDDNDNTRQWNARLGSHFTTEHQAANEFAESSGSGHVYHVGLNFKNPKRYSSEFELGKEGHQWASDRGYKGLELPDQDRAVHDRVLTDHPHAGEIAEGFRNHLRDQGHDGVLYGNEYEGSKGHLSAIALHPDQVHIQNHHSPYQACEHQHECPECGAMAQTHESECPECGEAMHTSHTAAHVPEGTKGKDSWGHDVEMTGQDGWSHKDGSIGEEGTSSVTDRPVYTKDHTWLPEGRYWGPNSAQNDQRLFDGDHLRPEVRQDILSRVGGVLGAYDGWEKWARVYFAGSEAGKWQPFNGDFDILIGIDFEEFRDCNPQFEEMEDAEIASTLTEELWTRANVKDYFFTLADGRSVGPFDRTFFVNARAWDIENLHPYAAYNVTSDDWAVHPLQVPKDWNATQLPESYWGYAEALVHEIEAIGQLPAEERHRMAANLWEELHTHRSDAFADGGHGLYDLSNVIEKYLDQHPDKPWAKLVQWKNDSPSGPSSWVPTTARRITLTTFFEPRTAATGADYGGMMIAIVPPKRICRDLAIEDGEPVDAMHVTLAYLGGSDEYTAKQRRGLRDLVEGWARTQKALEAHVGGVGTFVNPGQHVLWAAVDIPGGGVFRESLVETLERHGYNVRNDHGWTPHLTLSYDKAHFRFMPKVKPASWDVTEVMVCVGGAWEAVSLG